MGDSPYTTVALVPLRGGSKSIPLKNIKTIAGKPLCIWVLEAALRSGVFNRVVVSTDEERIAQVVRRRLPDVEIINRPAEFAADTSSTESVMMHLASQMPFEVLCTIQATSPLTTASDFLEAHKLFQESKADSLLTAVRLKRFLWDDAGRPINYDPTERPRRQDFAGTLMENGAFYFTTRELLQTTGCRLGGRIRIYEMRAETAVELDELEDWKIIENLLLRRSGGSDEARIRGLRWFFFDVDGTLTDASMYYSHSGEMLKRFSTRDGFGIRGLQEAGLRVGLISSENSDIIGARAKKLQIETVFTGVTDKLAKLKEFSAEQGIRLEEIGFMGDDLNDLAALEHCGFSASPADAAIQVRSKVNYVCSAKGGCGAVRELCDRLQAAREPAEGEHNQ